MSVADGRIVRTTKIVDHGPDAVRWNLVLLAEGYRQSELTTFAADARAFADRFLETAPFAGLATAINVHRIDVASTDSGADKMDGCDDTALRKTYFDATHCADGVERLLTVDTATVFSVVEECVPLWDVAMVIVNSTTYGGSGADGVPVASLHADAQEIALHELGHSAFDLADEYDYYWGRDVKEDVDRDNDEGRDQYEGPEPVEPNVTATAGRAVLKWRHLVANTTPLPTTENADCLVCDPQSEPPPAGRVGAFEGAYYHHCGVYRATFDCRMRTLGQPFCPVCREHIQKTLRPYQPQPQRRKRMDFTLITPTALQFGNVDSPALPGVFVGASKEFAFDCPGVDPAQHAVLMYQVANARAFNGMTINGAVVPNAVPNTTTDTMAFNASVVLVSPNTLRPGGNVLRIQAAIEPAPPPLPGQPPQSPSLDEFVIDNVVLMYKTV